MSRLAAKAPGLICVCGLAAEARIARRAGFAAVVGAGDRPRTAALVGAAGGGTRCLVSFGTAGALSPALRPGDLILSADIVSETGCWRGDEAWRRRIGEIAHTIGAANGPLLGAAEILATRGDKARALTGFAALAVDLESDLVAQAATRAAIPFAALRAIADPAARDLPPAALVPLAPTGQPDLARVAGSLCRRPWQLAGLFALARETRQALIALERAAPALCSLLGDQ
jgi:adenosylhomocysteine nucleosidase